MSRLKLLAPAGVLVLFCAWLLLKDPVALALHDRTPAAAPAAPDPADPEHWLIAPDAPPPSLWDAGWDIDLFLLPPRPRAWTAPGPVAPGDSAYAAQQARTLDALVPLLADAGTLYTPVLRLPSPVSEPGDWSLAAADLDAAVDHYFDKLNTGRAVAVLVPAGDHPLVPPLMATLADRTEIERARIVSVVMLDAAAGGPLEAALSGCTYGGPCPLRLDVRLAPGLAGRLAPQPPGGIHRLRLANPIATGTELAALRADWLDYLETSVPRPAEPLGGFETIEVAPVYTPDGERLDTAAPPAGSDTPENRAPAEAAAQDD